MSRVAVLTFGIFPNDIKNTTLPTFDERAANIFKKANDMPVQVDKLLAKSIAQTSILT